MPIQPGQMLSHYRLVEKIGEGGMGVVWKALDTTLDREVAVKILPAEFSGNPERLARFEREAKLLASLNHAGIATLYGLEEHKGRRFLVMELVEGEDLARRIGRGPIPVDAALPVALQIAEGLEAANERGIVHRDLKPANVMLSSEGKVKILDFGLAKAWRGEEVDAGLADSPTLTADATAAGVLLGTAAYMSPEQARGKPVDRRTDIWAFGCLLYEMLTGKSCFGGETHSDTLAGILERQPDWSAVPAGTPEEIRGLLRRCLRKDPRRRLRDIGEARVAIEDLGTAESTEVRAAARGFWRRAVPWGIAALMTACAVVAVWTGRRAESPVPRSPTRLAVSLPPQQRLAVAGATSIALSPDGSRLVYSASSPPGSGPRLYQRRLDRFEAVPIPGTDGAVGPFFSPDSRWLAYFAEDRLFKIALEGGAPVEVCHVGQVVPGASWGPDGSIFFVSSPNSGLVRVSAEGGTPERLTTPDFAAGESGHGWPRLLPGGESMLFTISGPGGTRIALLSLRTGEWRTLDKGMGGARYLSSGHLVFARSEGLVAMAFDPTTGETAGAPVVVQEDVYMVPGEIGFGLAAFSVSDTGVLAFLPGGTAAGRNRLVWVDRDGRTRPATDEPGNYEWPGLSPDGGRAVFTNRTPDGQVGLWVLDLERDARSRLTLEGSNITPIWTPDGKRVVFGSVRGDSGVVSIFWKSADGSGGADRLLGGDNPRFPRSWTPDGRLLAFTEWNPDTMRDIWTLSTEGAGESRPILDTRFDEHSPVFSPDGHWLAYVSDETGRNEVYVRPQPSGRGKWLISAGGGTEPVWSADGQTLFYRNADAMMEVPIRTAPSFGAGTPRVVFERSLKTGAYDSLSYDVSADGRRFLMIERDLESAPNRLNIVLDWDKELRNRVPTGPE